MESFNILIGVTGSVASIKLPVLVAELQKAMKFDEHCKVRINVVATEHSLHFFKSDELPDGVTLLVDKDEWKDWKVVGDPIQHIELRRWADVFIIAPLDANSMAKISVGICDNLLTSIVRAWDSSKPLFFAPAMNTLMWNHPSTAGHVDVLTNKFGYHIIPPVTKTLACGDTGVGAMASPETICRCITKRLSEQSKHGYTLQIVVISSLISIILFKMCHKAF